MAGWIKFDKDMANDPRLAQAAVSMLEQFMISKRDVARDGTGDVTSVTPASQRDVGASHGDVTVYGKSSHGDASRDAASAGSLSTSDATRFWTHALRGALIALWCYADEHIRSDDSLPCDSVVLDAIIGLDNFCNLLPDEWLTVREDGNVVLPGYCDKNGVVSKRKSLMAGAERTRRWRERKKHGDRDNGDASHIPSRKASQPRHRDVTKSVDLDLDLLREEVRTRNAGGPKETPDPESASRGPDEFDPGVADRDLDPEAYLVWTSGLAFLGGESKRSVLGMLVKRYTRAAVAQKLGELMRMTEPPKDPTGYLVAAMQKTERKAVC